MWGNGGTVSNNECIALIYVINWDVVDFKLDFAMRHQDALRACDAAISFQLDQELQGKELTWSGDGANDAWRNFDWQGDEVTPQEKDGCKFAVLGNYQIHD